MTRPLMGDPFTDLAKMKSDEGLFRESFEKYARAWDFIKNLKQYTHPLMLNTGLEALKVATIIGNMEMAEQIFLEIVGSLGKIPAFKTAIPFFFDFFKFMANKGKIAEANSYLERLLNTRFKKGLNQLRPFRFLFQYLDKKDDSIIRRQPPEIQKILNKMIGEIEQKNGKSET